MNKETSSRSATDREYYQKNKEQYTIRGKIYYQKNKKAISVRQAKHYRDPVNREKKSVSMRRRYLKERDTILIQHRTQRIELLKFVGGCKCKRCGNDDWMVLQIDHVYGGGNKEQKENKRPSSPKIYQEHITKTPNKYQILCANCNWIKRYENKEHRQWLNGKYGV